MTCRAGTIGWRRALLAWVLLCSAAASAGAEIREGDVPVDGGSLHFRAAGATGSRIVLLHGYLGSSRDWTPYLETLARAHRVLAFDLPGHGGSDRLREDFAHRAVAAAVLDALDRLEVRRFALVGHSSGALVALRMALQQPARIESLVAVATPWHVSQRLRDTASAITMDSAPPEMLEALRKRHPGGDAQIAWLLEQQRRIARDPAEMSVAGTELAGLAVPVLLVHGDRDALLPLADAVDLHGHLGRSRLLVLPDTGHRLPGSGELAGRLLRDAIAGYLGG